MELISGSCAFSNFTLNANLILVIYKRDKKTWKQYINKQKLKGIHLIADQDWQSEFVKTYSVVKIPRAILIDKDGMIINAYAPKPSQKTQLSKLLSTVSK